MSSFGGCMWDVNERYSPQVVDQGTLGSRPGLRFCGLAPPLAPTGCWGKPTSSFKIDHWSILAKEMSTMGAIFMKMAVFFK